MTDIISIENNMNHKIKQCKHRFQYKRIIYQIKEYIWKLARKQYRRNYTNS